MEKLWATDDGQVAVLSQKSDKSPAVIRLRNDFGEPDTVQYGLSAVQAVEAAAALLSAITEASVLSGIRRDD